MCENRRPQGDAVLKDMVGTRVLHLSRHGTAFSLSASPIWLSWFHTHTHTYVRAWKLAWNLNKGLLEEEATLLLQCFTRPIQGGTRFRWWWAVLAYPQALARTADPTGHHDVLPRTGVKPCPQKQGPAAFGPGLGARRHTVFCREGKDRNGDLMTVLLG